ncbi:MAG: T9SS type A sorting domain-containing protein [Bacteroidota bacterium]
MKKIVYLMVLSLLLINRLQSQIAFTGSNSATGSSSSYVFANTVPSGNNVLFLVGVVAKEENISSVTFTGTAMTQLTLTSQGGMQVALYYKEMGNLASNVSGNVVVNLASPDQLCVGAAYYSGVLQSAPLVNTNVGKNQSTNASVTFNSSTGNLGISMIAVLSSNAITNGAGQTQRWSAINSQSNVFTQKAGANSVTMSHTIASSKDWAMIGASLQASNITLDIELKDFYVNCYSNYYQLNWSTATEKNTNYFKVERSLNMMEWTEIARVKAAGNSVLVNKYDYRDEFDVSSDVYYRLVEVDLDKTEKVLKIQIAPCAVNLIDEIWIYPNPSVQSFILNFKLKQAYGLSDVVIQDNLGKIQFEETVNLTNLKLSKMINHNLSPGFYHLSVISGNGVCLKRIPFIVE